MWSKRLLYDGLPNAPVFLSLQTELDSRSFCVHNLLSLRGRLFYNSYIFGENWSRSLKISSWWWQYKLNENKTAIQQRNNFNFDQATICQRTLGRRNSLLLNRKKRHSQLALNSYNTNPNSTPIFLLRMLNEKRVKKHFWYFHFPLTNFWKTSLRISFSKD